MTIYDKTKSCTLYNEICSIKEDTNYIELANKLVNQIDEIDDESFADDTVYIVQPAGNPKFQYSLGE